MCRVSTAVVPWCHFIPASKASRGSSPSGAIWAVFGAIIAVIPLDRQTGKCCNGPIHVFNRGTRPSWVGVRASVWAHTKDYLHDVKDLSAIHLPARIAQLVERTTSNREVSGSNPLVSITFFSFFSFSVDHFLILFILRAMPLMIFEYFEL